MNQTTPHKSKETIIGFEKIFKSKTNSQRKDYIIRGSNEYDEHNKHSIANVNRK